MVDDEPRKARKGAPQNVRDGSYTFFKNRMNTSGEKTSDNKSSVASGKSNSEASVHCLDAFITELLGTRVVSDGYL